MSKSPSSKILVVAANEFAAAVRTKAFLIGVLFTPALIAGMLLFQKVARNQVDTDARRFAVIDYSGQIFPVLAAAAQSRSSVAAAPAGAPVRQAVYQPVEVAPTSAAPEQLRVDLSEQIRRRQLYAFVEIPAGIDSEQGTPEKLRYHTDHTTDVELPRWIAATVTEEIRTRRIRRAGLDPALVARLQPKIGVEPLGLLSRSATGKVEPASKVDGFAVFGVPSGMMILILMVILASAPQQLNTVIEEKLSRISEVLLGSLSPFQLMAGKLLGSVAVGLCLASLYLGAALWGVHRYGFGHLITPTLLLSFFGFVVLGVLMFSALFMAVGAAASELKDAQGMMMPVMLLCMLPAMTFSFVVQSPHSGMSRFLSMFPFSAPILMPVRLAISPAPPVWQVTASVLLCAATTVLCVFAAGRVFRQGLLAQGKSANFAQMARWVLRRD